MNNHEFEDMISSRDKAIDQLFREKYQAMKSRDSWKMLAMDARREIRELRSRIKKLERKLSKGIA